MGLAGVGVTTEVTEANLGFIKYMGSKKALLPHIAPVLRNVVPEGGRLLDLFAGQHTIGYALKRHCDVWGNDIQAYTLPLGRTLLTVDPLALSTSPFMELVPQRAQEHYEELLGFFGPWVDREERTIASAVHNPERGMREYAKFSQDLASLLGEQPQALSLPQRFARLLRRVHQGRSAEISLMSTVYWADSYFSLAQAMWLDAYRRAIEGLPTSDPARDPAIASLLHAAAYSSNSSGHFAQHRKPTSPDALAALARYRLRSVPRYWLAKMREVAENLIGSTKTHSVTNRNFADLLRPDVLETIDAVYADPPYSAVHYSRFYHVLESLTLYDHPGSEFDGRYRPLPLRHQSPFSIESQVNAAFNTLIEGVAKAGKPLVISYSDSALLPMDRLKAMCRTHYPNHVDVIEIGYNHATMGRRDTKSNAVVELLIVCRN